MWIVLLALFASFASGQKVMSSRSGMIYYSEAAVTLDGKNLRAAASDRRPQIQDGQTFGAVRGHAEILMGPNSTLWINPGALVRFEDTSADQPEITLLAGGAIVEMRKAMTGSHVRVHVGDQLADVANEGVYRFEASRIRVYAGDLQLNGSKLMRGQEWTEGTARAFERKDRDPFLYFAAYRSLQLEGESGSFRLWHTSNFTERSHAGFGIDFPESAGSARVKYLTGGEAGLVYFLQGSAVTGGKAPVMTNRLPFRLGEDNYLRTEKGRAEIFLGVGMIARIGENSQLRMMDTQPLHPMIALDEGSAVIEVTKSSDDPQLRVRVGSSITSLDKPGVYQFDAQDGSLRIYGGQANAMISDKGMTVRQGQKVSLLQGGPAASFNTSQRDALYQWSADRSFQLYVSPAAFMTAWEPMSEPQKVRHKYFGNRIDRRPPQRRRRVVLVPPV